MNPYCIWMFIRVFKPPYNRPCSGSHSLNPSTMMEALLWYCSPSVVTRISWRRQDPHPRGVRRLPLIPFSCKWWRIIHKKPFQDPAIRHDVPYFKSPPWSEDYQPRQRETNTMPWVNMYVGGDQGDWGGSPMRNESIKSKMAVALVSIGKAVNARIIGA